VFSFSEVFSPRHATDDAEPNNRKTEQSADIRVDVSRAVGRSAVNESRDRTDVQRLVQLSYANKTEFEVRRPRPVYNVGVQSTPAGWEEGVREGARGEELADQLMPRGPQDGTCAPWCCVRGIGQGRGPSIALIGIKTKLN